MRTEEDRGWRIEDRGWKFSILYPLFSILFLVGCASNTPPSTQPVTLRQRQDAMLANPGDYPLPRVENSVSGGGTAEFDKEGFKRDIDHVLNP